MTTFDKRQDAFEAKFARDEELRFKAEARRNKLLGLWAAEKLGTARVMSVDPRTTPRVGTKQFPQTLALGEREVVLTFDLFFKPRVLRSPRFF